METCLYCGRHKKLIQLGEPVHTNEYDGRVQYLYICADGHGCQKKYKDKWLGALRGSLYYDLPYLLLTIPAIFALWIVWVPYFDKWISLGWCGEAVKLWIFLPLIIPVVGFFGFGFPTVLSFCVSAALAVYLLIA